MKRIFFLFVSFLSIFFLATFFSSCSEHASVVIVNGLGDLSGKKIGCVAKNSSEEFIVENINNAEIVSCQTNEDVLKILKKSEVAVAILDKDFALPFVETSEDFAVSDFKLSDENLVIVQRAFDMKITDFWKMHDKVGADF